MPAGTPRGTPPSALCASAAAAVKYGCGLEVHGFDRLPGLRGESSGMGGHGRRGSGAVGWIAGWRRVLHRWRWRWRSSIVAVRCVVVRGFGLPEVHEDQKCMKNIRNKQSN
jgi:hypothetical protein